MLVHNLGFLLLMLIAVKAEPWTIPTVNDMQTALETCQISYPLLFNDANKNNLDVRCFAQKLGLWADDEGFKTKRFVKLLKKYHQPIEISIVIDFCNKSRRQEDTAKWAKEAFNCFARGRIGLWINEFIKNVYKNKTTK